MEDCALTVKTTIVSRPSADRAVIDAGTKVFNGVDPSIPASILKTHGDWHTNDDESHPIA
ncbi:D-serine deaminase-like pyridoxal phosphate-dependent protein [Paenibacillus sp. V4I3]|uniref:hypothetical protein n=1 Tax=unclassified Paenibacillus TaxID=185978 RepID=UPI002789AB3E|nr:MULTISPECIES: hypothetical protein [unclassified Paenibacillus]MDQ0875676.1 D-serine deaminase-like pyridoxal phosphate-dependent protein [Paenibacillus sp. V4I3]MDQ0888254.1 D-serine deaminase-like pyridoxal phosphate-dependent protein [Paenibacillus sp. V4I9]